MRLIKDIETLHRLGGSIARSSGRITRLPTPEEFKKNNEYSGIRGKVQAEGYEVVMGDATILQTLQNQAIQRAIGELMAARETMRIEENGESHPLDKVIQECIQMLRDNMR